MTNLQIFFLIVIALCALWGAFYIGLQVGRELEFERLTKLRGACEDEFGGA